MSPLPISEVRDEFWSVVWVSEEAREASAQMVLWASDFVPEPDSCLR